MVTTTQIATCPECKSRTGCKEDCECKQGKRILVDYQWIEKTIQLNNFKLNVEKERLVSWQIGPR